ncbi:GSHPx-domain-containing protein [Hyaloscypha variabilis F]|uniref:Glutathione peroxidase n=1 Tax=Hyaloscypha variabilis (strain UAMH 11265 / GT02V1 / F) TaxID=1149755 RepID=A0A2J6QSE5_HYAVF|nr:GSHPx-domain-containing protein [Hyaloscypha variabilis F]
MKRFTNPQSITLLHIKAPSHLHLIKPKHLMQAQQSLFQSAFKDPNQRVAHGVKKSIPFLNLWAPSADVQRQQEQKRQLNMASATSFYDFKPLDKKGTAVPLETYKGKVVLIVNTASKCGFTPQYQGLESLYKKIQASHPDQFVILGFPCNQFGGQEPGSDEEIQSFCQLNYGVSFPIMGKTDVNGDKANPLFEWLKNEQPGLLGMKRVKWNFEKWLVGKDGAVKGRWASTTKPESLEKEVLAAINA